MSGDTAGIAETVTGGPLVGERLPRFGLLPATSIPPTIPSNLPPTASPEGSLRSGANHCDGGEQPLIHGQVPAWLSV